jgi:hypothetical protein
MGRRNYLIAEEIQSHKENPYRNELFHKKRLRTKWQKRLGFIIPSVFLAGIIISLLLSPFFRITTVSIIGATTIDPIALESAVKTSLNRTVLGIFPRRQTPFFKSARIREDLADFDLESIEVRVDNHVLTVTVKERVSEIILRAGEGYQLVGLDGTPTRAPSEEETTAIALKIANKAGELSLATLQPSVPVIDVVGDYTSDLHPFQIATPAHILEVDSVLRSLEFIPYLYVFETDREGWFVVKTANRPDLYLDAKTPPAEIRSLLTVTLSKIESLDTVRYIDARFGSAIYYQ